MPHTTTATVSDIHLVEMFDPPAAARLLTMFNEGKTVEKVESSFKDAGGDYVDFKVGDDVICHISGY